MAKAVTVCRDSAVILAAVRTPLGAFMSEVTAPGGGEAAAVAIERLN